MTLLVVVLLVVVFVLVVGTAVLVRSRGSGVLEAPPPAPPEAEPLPEELVPEVLAPEELAPEALAPEALPPEALPPEAVAPEGPPTGAPVAPVRPRIRDRIGKARALVSGYVGSILSRSSIDETTWEDIEEALIRADVGVATTGALIESLRLRVKAESISTPEDLLAALRAQVVEDLAAGDRSLRLAGGATNVWLFVGVNGVGKTTTIGKLGLRHAAEGRRVVMAAGDTFRAAAAEQLELWARRVGADLVRGAEGSDPGAVVFDAVQRAAARRAEVVLADTAGRLHTKVNLMEELRKIRRVAERDPGQVTEVLLVIDATTGQNGLTQAREFAEAVGVTGVVLTKLDGTAKGGIVLAIQAELGIPVKLVGVGEAPEDLVDFDPEEFVEALFSA